MTKDDIIKICKKYNIKNYSINSDMSVDVDGHVKLFKKSLTKLPLKFGKVTGNFSCFKNNLTTLEGCPNHIGGDFNCSVNNLTTLEGCPNHVGGYFDCSFNKLTTLQHLSMNFYVGGEFYCYKNNITEAKEFGKLLFGTIGGEIFTDYENLNSFFNEHKNPPKKDLPRLLSELRKIQL